MAIELPALPYSTDALAPTISSETLEFHYGKHHAGYVTKLNGFLEGTPQASASLEEIVKDSSGKIFNNAAQIWNHTFYWNSMKPGGSTPGGDLAAKIDATFGSLDGLKGKFLDEAANHFGSGWAWLVQNKGGDLEVISTHDAGCPVAEGLNPLITCDVWEHAYYIDYRNARPDYLAKWWDLVNWDFAAANMK